MREFSKGLIELLLDELEASDRRLIQAGADLNPSNPDLNFWIDYLDLLLGLLRLFILKAIVSILIEVFAIAGKLRHWKYWG